MAEYINLYDEATSRDTDYGTLIIYPLDDSYWTLIQINESEIE